MTRPYFFLASVLCLMLFSSPAAGETIGKGDFEFFLDSAAFRAENGTALEEIYVRIQNSELRFREAEGRFRARVEMLLRVRRADGEVVVREKKEIKFYADSIEEARSPLQFQLITRKYTLDGGNHSLSLEFRDLNSPKVTIVGMIKGKYNSASARKYPLIVPAFDDNVMALSDGKFFWDSPQEGVYRANPTRLYGLYRDSLRVYMEAYVPEAMVSASDIHLRTIVIDKNGESATESEIAIPHVRDPGGSAVVVYPLVINEDLNRFPAGGYTLYLNVEVDGKLLLRVRAGQFNVAWDMRTWEVSRNDYIAEARFLLDADDFKEFLTEDVGVQEAIVQRAWKDADPDPSTGVNEAYEEFIVRLDFVTDRYSDYQLGFFTDRGLIYLEYGPPDEMVVDAMPLNRESISDALQMIEDRFHVVNFSNTGGRIGYATPSRNIVVDPRRLGSVGEGGEVAFPYELWIYNGTGNPILERDRSLNSDIGLRFIFVDKDGYGRYKLESSSSLTHK